MKLFGIFIIAALLLPTQSLGAWIFKRDLMDDIKHEAKRFASDALILVAKILSYIGDNLQKGGSTELNLSKVLHGVTEDMEQDGLKLASEGLSLLAKSTSAFADKLEENDFLIPKIEGSLKVKQLEIFFKNKAQQINSDISLKSSKHDILRPLSKYNDSRVDFSGVFTSLLKLLKNGLTSRELTPNITRSSEDSSKSKDDNGLTSIISPDEIRDILLNSLQKLRKFISDMAKRLSEEFLQTGYQLNGSKQEISNWVFDKISSNIGYYSESLMDKNLPDILTNLVEDLDTKKANKECIKLYVCKSSPLIWKMQDKVTTFIDDGQQPNPGEYKAHEKICEEKFGKHCKFNYKGK